MNFNNLFSVFRESIGNIHREIKITFSSEAEPEKWLFLVGCYNSGTTLLAELLSKHSSISALPDEGHFLTDQFVKDYDVGLPRMWCLHEELFRLTEKESGPDVNRIKKEWAIRLKKNKPVYLEKSPPNTPRTRWLQKHFRPAYFIVIVRNGYAVAEGIKRKADPKHLPEGWTIEQAANQWRRSYEVLHEDEKYLDNVLWIKYEEFTEDLDKALEKICEFVDIPKFKSFNKDTTYSIHEKNEKIINMNESSINKLSKTEIQKINEVAGDYMEKLGYELINNS